jgi:hypothetical protein
VRQALREQRGTMERLRKMTQRLEDVPYRSVLDATTLPLLDADAFLGTAIHEVARDLEVRRCSLVLAHADGRLRVRASVGLPRDRARGLVGEGSISGHVFQTGEVLMQGTLPPHLADAKRGQYFTESFMCHPIREGARLLGVLNLSDRNDGREFSPGDIAAVGDVTRKLAMSLALLPSKALEPPPERPMTTRLLFKAAEVSQPEQMLVAKRKGAAAAAALEGDLPGDESSSEHPWSDDEVASLTIAPLTEDDMGDDAFDDEGFGDHDLGDHELREHGPGDAGGVEEGLEQRDLDHDPQAALAAMGHDPGSGGSGAEPALGPSAADPIADDAPRHPFPDDLGPDPAPPESRGAPELGSTPAAEPPGSESTPTPASEPPGPELSASEPASAPGLDDLTAPDDAAPPKSQDPGA